MISITFQNIDMLFSMGRCKEGGCIKLSQSCLKSSSTRTPLPHRISIVYSFTPCLWWIEPERQLTGYSYIIVVLVKWLRMWTMSGCVKELGFSPNPIHISFYSAQLILLNSHSCEHLQLVELVVTVYIQRVALWLISFQKRYELCMSMSYSN